MKVAIIGECMAELYQNNNEVYTQTFGGDTFNCSVYMKRSLEKLDVEYITVLGEDELSSQMLEFMKEQDLSTNYIDRVSDKNPGLYIISTKDGERSFSYWRSDSAAKKLFLDSSLEKVGNDLLEFDMIYFSAITLAIMSEKGRENLFKAVKKARAAGVKIAYDSNYRPSLYKDADLAKKIYDQALHYCDIYLPSIDDENLLWGDITIDEIITNANKAGCNEVVVKCGAQDVIYDKDGLRGEISTKKLENIVDSTSAGDSFNAAYLAARLDKLDVESSINKAKELASKVIMYQGSIIPKEGNK